jgi:SAM-dependent methyltransferase
MKVANIFDNAQLYKFFQFAVISNASRARIRNEVLKPLGVSKVLDFGCGIGYHSEDFKNSEYFGIEPLPGCVEKANRLFKLPNRTFVVGDHRYLKDIPDSSFETIIAHGVLHHINDAVFLEFLMESQRILKPGGRLTTFDPVFHENQSFLSRWVVSKDRGEYVRTTGEYLAPVEKIFNGEISHKIYKGLLRIPYDHIHMEILKQKV